MKFRLLSVCIVVLAYTCTLQATIVIPFDNIGHLAESSDEIIIGTVINQEQPQAGMFLQNSWNIRVNKSFQNALPVNSVINIGGYGGQGNNTYTAVSGDINLEEGETYLMFLDHSPNGAWRTRTLSYYLYKMVREEGKTYYVPVKEGLDIHIEGVENHRLMVIDGKVFPDYLTEHVQTGFANSWDDLIIKADKSIEDFYPELKAPPGHCAFLNAGGFGFRWNVFPAGDVQVYYDTEVDAEQMNSPALVADAVTDLSTNYAGLNLPAPLVVPTNFTPTCLDSNGDPATVQGSTNFTSYSNTLNGGDNILMVFNDPCNQIGDLASCSGTLAVGGSSAYSPRHIYDGLEWWNSIRAFMVMNNGVGPCLSDADYTLVIVHEATHGLSLNHIAGSGTANMNPECCNAIMPLDVACMDYLYAPVVPVELSRFSGTITSEGNLLQWTTASESNSDVFEIERSSDGTRFNRLSSIAAQGFSDGDIKYHYVDKAPFIGESFYRLKQIDFDGAFEYSEVVKVNNEMEDQRFAIYPNPATTEINIQATFTSSTETRIVDMMGNTVKSIKGMASQIDISDLSKGIYYITIDTSTGTQVQSFVKL